MCGLFAVLDQRGATRLDYSILLDQLAHRGPDSAAIKLIGFDGWTLPNPLPQPQPHVALGHLRLSILDLDERSDQPFESDDGKKIMVYNGEIYNYIEIREELKALGYSFRTQGDTEVLLKALEQWPVDIALNRCEGMFAFVLYNRGTGDLLVGRDHLGIKPLFFANWDGGRAYASEVWPLLSLPGVSHAPRAEKQAQYLLSGGQEHDGTSFFRDIQRVPSGHYERFNIRRTQTPERHRFWRLETPRKTLKKQDAIEAFREQFLANVRLHLRSDVPLGVALSGGLDSSAIAGAVRHIEPDATINTFSFLPETEEWSEEKWVDKCVDYIGTVSHKIRPAAQDLISDLSNLIKAQGEPFGSTSIYAQFRVMRLAADSGIKVMLDGQGADELLGGYEPYVGARLLSLLKTGQLGAAKRLLYKAPEWVAAGHGQILKNMLRYALPRRSSRYLRGQAARRVPYDWIEKSLLDTAQFFAPGADGWGRGEDFLRRTLQEATTKYGLPELLRYEDRNSMHVSIESRVPFLTGKMASLCGMLPENVLIDENGRSKSVLREAIKGLVPEDIRLRRDKIGFQPDIARMNGPIKAHFLEVYKDLELPDGLRWDIIARRLENDTEGKILSQAWVWRVLNIAFWHDTASKTASAEISV